MLSESQERMLIIVQKGREDEVKRIFDKWDLPWAEIGQVTDTGRMVVRNNGQFVADIPAKKLADEAKAAPPDKKPEAENSAKAAVGKQKSAEAAKAGVVSPLHRSPSLAISPMA